MDRILETNSLLRHNLGHKNTKYLTKFILVFPIFRLIVSLTITVVSVETLEELGYVE